MDSCLLKTREGLGRPREYEKQAVGGIFLCWSRNHQIISVPSEVRPFLNTHSHTGYFSRHRGYNIY